MNALFGIALLAALAVAAARALRRRWEGRERSRALARGTGMSAQRPIRIASFREMDDAVDTLRCPCGGPLHRIGEGSRPGVRVVRCECAICGEDVDLFFDLSELRH
jgi:hypothetical protein